MSFVRYNYGGYVITGHGGEWYCMNEDFSLYLKMNGGLHKYCGDGGWWGSCKQLEVFIDELNNNKHFIGKEDFEL